MIKLEVDGRFCKCHAFYKVSDRLQKKAIDMVEIIDEQEQEQAK